MRDRILICVTRAVLAIIALAAVSGAAVVYTTVSQDTVMLGDRIGLTVSLVVPPQAQIIAPETDQGFGHFTVKEWSFEKNERASSDSLAFHYVLSLYVAEQCTIPSLHFEHVIDDTTRDTLSSDAVPMRLVSLITSDSADIQDLKPQQNAGKPSLTWLWVVLSVVCLVAAVYFGRWAYLKGKKPPPPPPPKPPYEEAMEALDRLEARQLIAKGMVREYVFELSEILRRYIQRRFDTRASEYTTEEMLAWIEDAPLDRSGRGDLEWFFRNSDPVKFARHIPDRETTERFGILVRSLIQITRPSPAPAAAVAADANGGNRALQKS